MRREPTCRVSGGGGIRTLGRGVTPTTVFETAPFNHSGTPPRRAGTVAHRGAGARVPRMDDATLDRFADLIVGFGANVQPDQIVAVGCEPGKEHLTRALAASAYRHGAKFVDVQWFDPHVKRARIQHAREETLDFVPAWYGERVLALGEQRAARIGLSGPSAPGLLSDLDPTLVGKDRLPTVKEGIRVVNERTTNWTICPCPSPAWADLVFPDLPEEERLPKLEEQLLHVLRLDEEDPTGAWRARADVLVASAERLTERRFDALH